MLRPRSPLPALLAGAAIAVSGLALPPAVAAEPREPLHVEIDAMTPSALSERGRVRLRGSVTNLSEERWRAINVHAFIADTPITSSQQLAATVDVPLDAYVGSRITTPGTFDSVGSLAPGETVRFTIELRRAQLPVSEPGVYWFGVHALGTTTDVRDLAGRARTFLPLMSDVSSPVDTSLVVQLRRAVRHSRGGRIRDVSGWAEALGPGGSLHALTEFAAAAGARPLTWLVDPAVPDAVQRLIDGNPPRSAVARVSAAPRDGRSPGAGEAGANQPDDDPTPPDDDRPSNPAAAPGEEWLDRLEDALTGRRIMAVPYGDPDVSAATDHGPRFLAEARERSGDTLAAFDLPALPVVAPPEGYLPPEVLGQLPRGTVALLTDKMFPAAAGESVFHYRGRRVLTTSSGAVGDQPRPDVPLETVAVRQRILAEAAVRGLADQASPLLVMLPQGWIPQRPRAFFAGLDVEWVRHTDPATLASATQLDPDALEYPPEQRAAELPAANFAATAEFVDAGATLANVLGRDEQLDDQVMVEALTSLSYANRASAAAVRARTNASLDWLQHRLSAVRVQAPRGVTLSGAAGGIGTTVINRLDRPVTVSLKAITDAALQVDTPATIELAARSSQTVSLDARATTPGVHYVRLAVTDSDGTALGSSARLPVRSAQVSEVIWLILGVGVGLLFLAIVVRLVRRIRGESR